MDISADKLRNMRLRHNLSQELLAKQSGLSLRTIQRLEREGGGSSETLHALCATFNIDAEQLQQQKAPLYSRWHRATVISKIFLFMLLFAGVLSLMRLATVDISIYIDVIALFILIGYLSLSTLLCFGLQGIKSALSGIRFLASSTLYAQGSIAYLHSLYGYIYFNCYIAAALGSGIGLISLLEMLATTGNHLQFFAGLQVLAILWVYAAIVAECVIRPLRYKLTLAAL
ncbi:helix-turn-helix domain-containing protein [Alishewanella tabrizica]|uniref:HTH cro/C1-type domain-containing protein n=1 Tax=Alishewanella tabrizica TaxID=671278 RepID=A0ABQ2WCG4_9ALTE|nr:helix-turn-helix transcriptional regulator [Alishewanella tabrizica]GGW49801.1 hypothetical protein GCM10008111_01960 [Alishewanella tabrizica]